MAAQPEGEWVSALLRLVTTAPDVNSIFSWKQPPVVCVLLSLCRSSLAELRWSALMGLRFWRKRLRVFRSALEIHMLFELPPPALNRRLPLLCYFYADVGATCPTWQLRPLGVNIWAQWNDSILQIIMIVWQAHAEAQYPEFLWLILLFHAPQSGLYFLL